MRVWQFAVFTMCLLMSMSSYAMKWKSFEVTYSYDPQYKSGPKLLDRWAKTKIEYFKAKTITVKIPADMKEGEVIRGVMRNNGRFTAFAHKNRLAMYSKEGDYPYGGPHKTMLKELAKVSGHPEVEHAGAVVYGISNKGQICSSLCALLARADFSGNS